MDTKRNPGADFLGQFRVIFYMANINNNDLGGNHAYMLGYDILTNGATQCKIQNGIT